MKKISIYYVFMLMLLGIGACDEDMTKVTINEDIQQNVFSELSETSYTLVHGTSSQVFDSLEWTAPDYGFEAYVTYEVQIDVAGYDFANAQTIVSTDSLAATVTNGVINAAMLRLDILPREPVTVELRVMATVNDHVAPVYSNVQQVVVTPHSNSLYLIGDGQSWSLEQAAVLELTSAGTYQGRASLVEGGNFRIFAFADWGAQQWGWSYFEEGSIDDALTDGADADSNFRFSGVTGQYRVTVSLEENTIALIADDDPVLYLIGDPQGWGLNNDLQMRALGDGEFEVIAAIEEGQTFRFFEKLDWGATQYGFSYFSVGVAGELADAADNDSNFRLATESGIYRIHVSLNDREITVEATEAPSLYIIGDDQAWDLNNAFQLTWLGGGKYEGSTGFATSSIFRFFEEPDWGAIQYNYNYFLEGSIDQDHLSGVSEGDANFTVIAETGTYIITINLNAVEISMN